MSGFIRVSGPVWRRAAVANAYIVCVVASAVPMTIAGNSHAVSGRATRKYGLEQILPAIISSGTTAPGALLRGGNANVDKIKNGFNEI